MILGKRVSGACCKMNIMGGPYPGHLLRSCGLGSCQHHWDWRAGRLLNNLCVCFSSVCVDGEQVDCLITCMFCQ